MAKYSDFEMTLLRDSSASTAHSKLVFLSDIERRIMITDVLSLDEKIELLSCIFECNKRIAYDLQINREMRVQG